MTYIPRPREAELKHYGVKGMKWGVKKARTGNLDQFAKSRERVAAGKGTLRDKSAAVLGSSIPGMIKRGVKGQAAKDAATARAEIDRLATGKATALDVYRAYMTVSIRDVYKSRKDD